METVLKKYESQMPKYVKEIIDDPNIPTKDRWFHITEVMVKRGVFKKPECPHFFVEHIQSDNNPEDADKKMSKITANWNYIERVANDYDLLADFLRTYKGPLLKEAQRILLEYAEFLDEKLSCRADNMRIFKTEDDSFDFINAKFIYYQEFKKDIEIYHKIIGSKKERFK